MNCDPSPRTSITGFFGRELGDAPDDAVWLWDGYLSPGNITLLTSQWKSGKTTLLSILLHRMQQGGILADLPLRPARAVVVSEESRALWRMRHHNLDLSDAYLILQPFDGRPSADDWLGLIDHVADLHARQPVGLFAVDTLTAFLPGRNEANAAVVMEALLPLRRLTKLGLCVLLLHHPAKGEPLPGQCARGSGALASFTDINLEMSWYTPSDPRDRRRRILAYSRFQTTPRQLVIELNPDGTDYLVHGDFDNDEFTQNWRSLRLVLEDANDKKTRQQLRDEWPADFPRPSEAALARWLQRAVAAALVCQDGTGRRNDPFRYWLPDKLAEWEKDPIYQINQQLEKDRQYLRSIGIEV